MNARTSETTAPPSMVFVPELGFRPSDGVRLRAPVSVERQGRTLKVERLVSTSAGTELRYELTSIEANWQDAARDLHDELRDEAGRKYGPGGSWWSTGWAQGGVSRVASYGPLAPEQQRVQLSVRGGSTEISAWLELAPLDGALRQAVEGEDTKHGVTIRVRGIATNDELTALDLEASADASVRFIRGIGAQQGIRRGSTKLPLRDDRGRELVESDPTLPPRGNPREGTDVAVFAPLPQDAASFELIVDYVVLEEKEGEVDIALPVEEPSAYEFGPYPIRVLSSRLVEPPPPEGRSPFNPSATFGAVHLDLDLGDWHEDRLLLFPGSVLSDGKDHGFRWRPSTGGEHTNAQQITNLQAPSPDPTSVRTITMRYPTVHVRGPWIVRFSRPA